MALSSLSLSIFPSSFCLPPTLPLSLSLYLSLTFSFCLSPSLPLSPKDDSVRGLMMVSAWEHDTFSADDPLWREKSSCCRGLWPPPLFDCWDTDTGFVCVEVCVRVCVLGTVYKCTCVCVCIWERCSLLIAATVKSSRVREEGPEGS